MGKISKSELNDSLKLEIENAGAEIVNDFSGGVDKVASAELAKTLNTNQQETNSQLAQIELELDNKCDKVVPTETIITSGFASGWSGEIRIRKTQEGLVTLYISCNKSSIIATAGETIYNLPAELRPKDTSTFVFNASSAAYVYSKALVNLAVYNTGELFIIPASSQDLTNATTVPRIVASYYAVS